ncbi:MAG TPA: hypothetical protein DIU16_03030 [Candidatus Vogelbacteria bacterium]|uniref:ParB-like N-terminal domain-containing protein n=1 Tax=Candidatus Vogelbacteria bacterium RIFOXYD1_FULL_51_18 TaxID=1802440 RepID=A0A1G2QJT3_9BACT|nr:MAG: ParB-like protein partition protein [Parcubacteria group bacterium GW2011_GWC1_51_35]KKW26062.1 MAG: ParB-like protein partition protein [Parcubacteria group bacterium GW2011_GWF2_52_12]OHA60806.1 MAG: hypothetical protein A2569_02540 [Candidatus Vogelbacteria bacterium RIFOXYD1_FULL_51_18]HBC44402.1 hypothetical protein [Candidatus Vogelbacteria bacterium]HCQ92305.1 hypothetical protein [Candidatus Vogelbacteria bacterium]
MTNIYNNSIFWIEVDKILPNPYQPRHEFDEGKLSELAESIRQYGVLQPLVVTRREDIRDDGGITVTYELISGERRLRASKLAGVSQVPAIIRIGSDTEKEKLELAIIENLQREDLNAIDRAMAFHRLANEFGFKHTEIAKKVGKSREYVSNTIRILSLPQDVIDSLRERKITEGHTRPILMLAEKPEEQLTLFKEILYKQLTVREAEALSRRMAQERVRNKEYLVDPRILEIEGALAEKLGTRVHIEKRGEKGGKITIDFFSDEDLRALLTPLLAEGAQAAVEAVAAVGEGPALMVEENSDAQTIAEDDSDDLYAVSNFSL